MGSVEAGRMRRARRDRVGRRGRGGWGLFLLPFLLLACSEAGDNVDVSGEAPRWSLAAEPRTTIGQVEGEAEFLFSRVGPAILLPDGRIALADQDEAAIRIFLPDGSFDREIGRRGEGPGEFAYISRLEVAPPDTLVAHDGRLYRLTRFLWNGAMVSTLQLQADDGFPEVYLGKFSTGEFAFAWIKQGPRDVSRVTPDVMQLGRFDETGRLSSLLGTETGMLRMGSPLAFSPHLFAEMIGDSLFLTNGVLPEIHVWNRHGDRVRTIGVPLSEVDADLAWKELESTLQARGNEMALRLFETQPRAVAIPRISRMLVDDQDRLWVKRYDPASDSHLLMEDRGRGGEWLVLEVSGAVVGSIQLPEGFLLLDVRGDQALGKTRDALGVERVLVFDIVVPG